MNRLLAAALAACCLLAGAVEPRPPRVDFTSQPEGANVFIDGALRGVTPLTLFDLSTGNHHVRFELADYEQKDDFLSISDGVYAQQRHAELTPVKGLLLVTSDPAGCAISLDGLSLGETPRLITTLDAKGTYKLLLEKAGYQSRTTEVKFSGRTPLVKRETLILDSGVLEVASKPSGASVMVNGLDRGKTPLKLTDIPKGRVAITLKLGGYRDVSRELTLNAGDSQRLDVSLEGIPGSLYLTSVPDGARFYIDGSAQGKGPIELANVAPGTYKVRAQIDGYGDVEKTVVVGNGQTVREEFKLESVLGRLEVRTQPVGAQVFVDGRLCGVTKSESQSSVSDVLTVDGLTEGEHTLILKRAGYGEVVKRPHVESRKATAVDVKLKRVFTPNIRIETLTGTYTGVLVNNGVDNIVIEVSMGVTRSFPRVDVRKVELLDVPQ